MFLLVAATGFGADWGDLSVRFVLEGAIPSPKSIAVDKDQDVCGKQVIDEAVPVNPLNKGIGNVVVYLNVAMSEKKPPVHDDYKLDEKASVVLDNTKCRFEPRVVTLRTTQTLIVGNKDPVGHNTKVDTFRNPGQNPVIPAGGQLKMNFPLEETSPAVPVSCGSHPWMKAHLIIKETPYMAVSNKDGNLSIKNLPVGNWTFQIWHEASGYVTEGNLKGNRTKWERGRAKLEIKPGGNDLGEIKLGHTIFEKK